jgi:imidazolonepropionase
MNGDGVLVCPALVTMSGPVPRRGRDLERVEVIPDGAVAWRDGTITYAGPARDLPGPTSLWSPPREVAGAVIPGFVDCHTHLPFYGWRADEFAAKLSGRSYRDVHGEGGGIARSARLLAEASDDEVLEFCRALSAEMVAHGTTTFELKTGYGLSVEAELRQARLARRLGSLLQQMTTVTLLACHAVPDGLSREQWVDQVCQELIPAAAAEGLVDAVDVFVEDIAFTVDDFRLVAAVARRHSLAVRCHADQLGPSGAAQAAVSVGARNADHLNHVTSEEVEALGRSDTAAVVVPVADLVTGERPPPVADLLDAGAVVALATDFNPGTSPCLSMPEAIAVGCSLYRLSPLGALGAATINPAKALGRDDRVGSLVAGKRADFLVLEAADPSVIPYRPGHNPVVETWIGGERLYRREPR